MSNKSVKLLEGSFIGPALALALLLINLAAGFAPPTSRPVSFLPASSSATRLFSFTAPQSVGTTSVNGESQQSHQKGVEALQKLLKRQETELEETKRLLELYQTLENGNTMINATEDGVENSDFMSIAATLMKGFDYGFISRSEGASFSELKGGNPSFVGYGPPANVWKLGTQQFMRNLKAMVNEYEDEPDIELTPRQLELREKLEQLTLDKDEIWKRETADGPIDAPLIIKIPYLFLCWMLDAVFEKQYVPSRFFLLETVARMPYFS